MAYVSSTGSLQLSKRSILLSSSSIQATLSQSLTKNYLGMFRDKNIEAKWSFVAKKKVDRIWMHDWWKERAFCPREMTKLTRFDHKKETSLYIRDPWISFPLKCSLCLVNKSVVNYSEGYLFLSSLPNDRSSSRVTGLEGDGKHVGTNYVAYPVLASYRFLFLSLSLSHSVITNSMYKTLSIPVHRWKLVIVYRVNSRWRLFVGRLLFRCCKCG